MSDSYNECDMSSRDDLIFNDEDQRMLYELSSNNNYYYLTMDLMENF